MKQALKTSILIVLRSHDLHVQAITRRYGCSVRLQQCTDAIPPRALLTLSSLLCVLSL